MTEPSAPTERSFSDLLHEWTATQTLSIDFITRLERLLERGLRSRGLWNRPPTFLGYPELRSWRNPQDLRALAVDAFEVVIVARAKSLTRKATVYPDIEPLIWLNVQRFIGSRQAFADPAGRDVFETVKTVLQTTPDVRLGGGTRRRTPFLHRVACIEGASASPATGLSKPRRWPPPMPAVELASHLAHQPSWSETVTRVSTGVTSSGRRALRDLLFEAAEDQPLCFWVRDLVRQLREAARAWHQASPVTPDGDGIQQALDQAQERRWLLRAMMHEVAQMETRERKKAGLIRLIAHLERLLNSGIRMPTSGELAQALELPTSTLSDYLGELSALRVSLSERGST
ncbi:MAG: hypothetical protein ACFB9M_16070 [Myxococcota bacterium]